MSDAIAGRQVVEIDLHLHRSVITRIDELGNELGSVRIENDPMAEWRSGRVAYAGVLR